VGRVGAAQASHAGSPRWPWASALDGRERVERRPVDQFLWIEAGKEYVGKRKWASGATVIGIKKTKRMGRELVHVERGTVGWIAGRLIFFGISFSFLFQNSFSFFLHVSYSKYMFFLNIKKS
jgi:hypothetical protein